MHGTIAAGLLGFFGALIAALAYELYISSDGDLPSFLELQVFPVFLGLIFALAYTGERIEKAIEKNKSKN